jgi:ATP-dependent RNA helicase DDX55/SPB4
MSDLFSSLDPPLTPSVLACVEKKFGFTTMTPVQAATIPLFLQNKDVAVEAITGSGKTLAFIIPIIERLLKRSAGPDPLQFYQVGAIVLAPTRELAEQIYGVLIQFLDYLEEVSFLGFLFFFFFFFFFFFVFFSFVKENKLSSILLVGGIRLVENDIKVWKKTGGQIIVATPGRLQGREQKVFLVLDFLILFLRSAEAQRMRY